VLSKIYPYYLWLGSIVICLGLAVRVLAVLLVTRIKRYTQRERVFMAISWIPKATVQAALAGVILTDGERYRNEELKENGLAI
jgi:hypothetical protein